jgi:hypothetical protein
MFSIYINENENGYAMINITYICCGYNTLIELLEEECNYEYTLSGEQIFTFNLLLSSVCVCFFVHNGFQLLNFLFYFPHLPHYSAELCKSNKRGKFARAHLAHLCY